MDKRRVYRLVICPLYFGACLLEIFPTIWEAIRDAFSETYWICFEEGELLGGQLLKIRRNRKSENPNA